MKTKADFHYKDKYLMEEDCIIDCVVHLAATDFEYFKDNLLHDYPFIDVYKKFMYEECTADGMNIKHCLLVMGDNGDEGVLINNAENNFATYTAFFPNAREFVQNRISELADALISEALSGQEDGSNHVTFDVIGERCGVTVTPGNGIGTMLLHELEQRKELLGANPVDEDGFELVLRAVNQSDDNLPTLQSMLVCEWENVHLCDRDEEHDLATIESLNGGTLTELGKEAWADVMNAKVHRVYNGYYGLQLELSGCDLRRLEDFSMMLAGYCSPKDFEKWVNQDDGICKPGYTME